VTHLNGAAILTDISGKGQANFKITDNGNSGSPLRNMGASAIAAGGGGSTTGAWLIDNNYIAAGNQNGGAFGISVGVGRKILADATTLANPRVNMTLTRNTTTGSSSNGLLARLSDSDGTLNIKVGDANSALGNNFANPNQPADAGLRVDSGSSGSGSFNPTVCAQIQNNTSGHGPPDSGDQQAGVVVYKRSNSASTYKFGIVGLAPSPANVSQTEANLTAQNPNSAFSTGFWATPIPVKANVGNPAPSSPAADNFTSCTLPF